MKEIIGRILGGLLAPFTFIGSLVRGERIFHPDGVVYRAEVQPLARDGAVGRFSEQLAGNAIIRLSGGIWPWPESERRPEILGVAIRFRGRGDSSPARMRGDLDLLLITARSLLTLPVAPFATDVNDFMANHYYAILSYSLEGAGAVQFRLMPQSTAPRGENRRDRLERAVANGQAAFVLQVLLEEGSERWIPIASIQLRERLEVDEQRLRFQPGTAAKGLAPRGVLQWARPAGYAASEAGRRLARRLR